MEPKTLTVPLGPVRGAVAADLLGGGRAVRLSLSVSSPRPQDRSGGVTGRCPPARGGALTVTGGNYHRVMKEPPPGWIAPLITVLFLQASNVRKNTR